MGEFQEQKEDKCIWNERRVKSDKVVKVNRSQIT